jgi:uncharacterized protein (DUF697 family)
VFSRKKQIQKIDYEKLGKEMERVLVTDYIQFLGSTKQQIWGAFIRGIFTGLGGVIGATFVVALLLTLLHFLGGFPFIGDFVQGVSSSISQGRR